MNWFYVENGQQTGPVTEEQFQELRRVGRVHDNTLVWHEGMPDWKPWREAGGPPPTIGSEAGLTCAVCSRTFRPEEVIKVNDRFVCGACKPFYLQRLREGVPGGQPTGPSSAATLGEVQSRDYEHDLGGYLSQGWDIFKSDPGTIIGATVLVYICIFAVSAVPFGIGMILSLVLTGPLIGGIWIFMLKKVRGETATVGDAFSGFNKFGQLALASLVSTVLTYVCFIPGAVVVGIGIAMQAGSHRGGSAMDEGAMITLMVIGGLAFLAGFIVAIYLQVCWMFTLPLVADKGMRFWPAMALSRQVVIKHWWMNFLIMIVVGIVGSAGMILCLVGALVTGPFAFATKTLAYEKLFGDMIPEQG